MRNITRAGILLAAITAALLAFTASPAGAQTDLNCGDPGTSHNMPVDPNNDPHNLDSDNDGEGCEDESVFGDAPAETPAPATPADDGVAQGPDAGDGSSLPRTGSTTTPLAIGGGALILLGAAAFVGRRHIHIPRHFRAG